MRVVWFADRATAAIALGTAVVAAVGLAVSIWYVLPRNADQDRTNGVDGSRSPAEPTVAVTTTFAASADTYVQVDTATTNYGTSPQFVVDGSPVRRSFLRFTVAGLAGPVTRAVLRVHTISDNTGSTSGGTWQALADTTWSETAATWNDQPEIDGVSVGGLGSVTRSTWYEIDVTPVVQGNGTFSIAGTSTSEDGAYFDTRESGANGPQLVVTTVTTRTSEP